MLILTANCEEEDLKMKKLIVDGMHCQKCVKRIDEALNREGIEHSIDLENKVLNVEDSKVETAMEVLDDLGF